MIEELKQVREALAWYADDIQNQHNYKSLMNVDSTPKAKEALATLDRLIAAQPAAVQDSVRGALTVIAAWGTPEPHLYARALREMRAIAKDALDSLPPAPSPEQKE